MSASFRPLSEPLPPGERILWQGKPGPAALLRQIFHVQLVVGYVGLLLGWGLVTGLQTGHLGHAAMLASRYAGLSAIVPGQSQVSGSKTTTRTGTGS